MSLPSQLKGLETFIKSRTAESPYLIPLWSPELETQCNVIDNSNPPEDDDSENFTAEPIRWPSLAGSNPKLLDRELRFSPREHADRIGSTWWNWVRCKSVAATFDIDATGAGHADSTNQVDADRLANIIDRLKALEYVTIVRSTGAAGVHGYVFFDENDQPQSNNHNEHTAVTKAVIGKMSRDAGFDFIGEKVIDVKGLVLWFWSRSSPADHPGFTLIHEATTRIGARHIASPASADKPAPTSKLDPTRPGDDFCNRATWAEILEPHGWKPNGGDQWTRPGKEGGVSASTKTVSSDGREQFTVFSTGAAPLEVKSYNKFTLFAALNHEGDFIAAADALRDKGYGAADVTTDVAAALQRFPMMTMRQLRAAKYEENYIIKDILIERQPLIIGGPSKANKTGVMLDMAYNLSVGGRFLGEYQCQRCRVTIMTGESGGSAIQRRINTFVANNFGIEADDDYFLVSESIPKFRNKLDMDQLALILEHNRTQVLALDPLYICMGGSKAGDLQEQGELLFAISDLCRRHGVTLVVAHHITKASAREHRFLHLEDLTQAGFAEWTRQWFLISRREPYKLESGIHKLWVSAGNSSSHSLGLAIDLNEGTRDEPRWEVDISSADEIKANKRTETIAEDIVKVEIVLNQYPDGLSQSELSNLAGINAGRWKNTTLPELLKRGILKEIPGKRKNAPHYIWN